MLSYALMKAKKRMKMVALKIINKDLIKAKGLFTYHQATPIINPLPISSNGTNKVIFTNLS